MALPATKPIGLRPLTTIPQGDAVRITIIGTGYLVAVHAACMAESGHEVLGVDVDRAKLTALSQGRPPFSSRGCQSCCGAL